jgi:hypothetical protein
MKTFLKLFCIVLVIIFAGCMSERAKEEKKDTRKNKLYSSIFSILQNNQIKSDCIYCDNTRAFLGSCSCYKSIAVSTCQGLTTGTGKSNSYKIYCDDLISKGAWTNQNNVFICNFSGCPPEAYRAAFTSDGR